MPKYGPRSFTGDRSPLSTGAANGCSVRTYWVGTDIDGSRRLCYQYGGDSESGLEPAGASGNWRCLALELLSEVEFLDGAWQTADHHSRPPTCIEEVELDVDAYPEPVPPIQSPLSKVQNSSLEV